MCTYTKTYMNTLRLSVSHPEKQVLTSLPCSETETTKILCLDKCLPTTFLGHSTKLKTGCWDRDDGLLTVYSV